jgi:hypothetical protein
MGMLKLYHVIEALRAADRTSYYVKAMLEKAHGT